MTIIIQKMTMIQKLAKLSGEAANADIVLVTGISGSLAKNYHNL